MRFFVLCFNFCTPCLRRNTRQHPGLISLPGSERDGLDEHEAHVGIEGTLVLICFIFIHKNEARDFAAVGATSIDDVGVIFITKDVVEYFV